MSSREIASGPVKHDIITGLRCETRAPVTAHIPKAVVVDGRIDGRQQDARLKRFE